MMSTPDVRSRDTATASFTLAALVLTLIFNLLAGVVVARSLGVEGRGQIAALVLWATIAMDIALLGTPASIVYHLARFPKSRAGLLRMLRRALPAMLLLAVLMYALLVFLADERLSGGFVGLFGVYLVVRMAFELVLAITQGDRRFRSYNMSRVVASFVPVAVFAGAWTFGGMSIFVAGLGYILALVLGYVAAGVHPGTTIESLDKGESRSFWSYSFRNWPAVLAAKGNANADLLVLTVFASTSSIGLYAVATSAASVLALVGTAAGIVALPRLASQDSIHKRRRVLGLLGFTAIGTGALSVVLFVTADWLIPLVFGDKFSGAVALTRILALGFVGASIGAFASAVLRSANRPGVVALAQFAGLVVTLGVALALDASDPRTVSIASSAGFWLSAAVQAAALSRLGVLRN